MAKDAAVAGAVSGVIPFGIPVTILQKLPTGCAAVFTNAGVKVTTDAAGNAWNAAKEGAGALWDAAKKGAGAPSEPAVK